MIAGCDIYPHSWKAERVRLVLNDDQVVSGSRLLLSFLQQNLLIQVGPTSFNGYPTTAGAMVPAAAALARSQDSAIARLNGQAHLGWICRAIA